MFTLKMLKHTVTVLLVMLLTGCGSGGSTGDAPTGLGQTNITEIGANTSADTLLVDQPVLGWTRCADQPSLECSSLLVPLDYSNPNGETVRLAIARRQADQSDPARTLFVNPGGPGLGGIKVLDSFLRFGAIATSMTDAVNFVSFDPRGVGESQAVNCDPTDVYSQNPYPTDRAALEFNFNKLASFAQSCSISSANYVQYLGSLNVVRDVNEMRKALGLTEIDFLGYSYGTRLAALYMQTYPQFTGRFVLDGSMKPEPDVAALAFGALAAGQANINALSEACIGVPILCSPDKFANDLQQRVDLLATAPASLESSLVFQFLELAATQPGFEQLLIGALARYLETQNVDELARLDTLLGLSEAAEAIKAGAGLNPGVFSAALCADDPMRPTVDTLDALREAFNAESDLLAETQVIVAGLCAGWPESIDPIPQIATNQAPASLVIGGSTDAQTPLLFAQQMAVAVGGQFLRSEHDGHTTVFSNKNNCTNAAVENFILTGILPTKSVCEANVK